MCRQMPPCMAVTCALAMQSAMRSFAAVPVPGREPVALAVKVAVACGPARRFLVGDPAILRYDVLAGETLYRMAEAEHHAKRGEMLLDESAVEQLGDPAGNCRMAAGGNRCRPGPALCGAGWPENPRRADPLA